MPDLSKIRLWRNPASRGKEDIWLVAFTSEFPLIEGPPLEETMRE